MSYKGRYYESATIPYSSTSYEPRPVPEGCVRFIIENDARRTTTYVTLLADNTAKERVYRGCGTVDDALEVIPSMTPHELSESGLAWTFKDGQFIDGAETLMREMSVLPVNAIRARRGSQYLYETVRSHVGVSNLALGTQQELALYRALLAVTLASAELEKTHDPDAVHLTPEIAAIVTEHIDKTERIIQYIKQTNTTARDIDTSHLLVYLTKVHKSLGEGFL